LWEKVREARMKGCGASAPLDSFLSFKRVGAEVLLSRADAREPLTHAYDIATSRTARPGDAGAAAPQGESAVPSFAKRISCTVRQ
jgi:hypothetical protein